MRTLFKALLIVYGIYLGLSMLVITPLLNFLPPWLVEQQLQRKLSTELVVFNPFTLALEVRKASLSEPDGSAFASLDRAAVNLSTSGLWQPGWVLDEVAIEGVDVGLKRYQDGSLNVASLVPPAGEAPEAEPAPVPETTTALPGVTVRELILSAHRIAVSDAARQTPYETHWDDLHLQMSNLSTVSDPGDEQRLQLLDEDNGQLSWEGEVSLPEGYSQGHIALRGLSLRPAWRFVRDQVDFELVDARLSAGLDYRIDWQDTFDFQLSNGELNLGQLSLRPAQGLDLADTGIDLAKLAVTQIAVDGAGEKVTIGGIDVDGLKVSGWMEDDRISLTELFTTRFPESEPSPEPSPWQVVIAEARVNGAKIDWRSPFTDPATLSVTPLDITISDISWPAKSASPLQLALTVNDAIKAQVEASLHLGSGDVQASYQIDGVPIHWFEPNMPDVLNARLDTGTAAVKGTATLAAWAPQQIAVSGSVQDFALRLFEENESITSWRALEWSDLQVDLPAQHIELAKLHLDGYSGRVHILEDGSLNVQHVLRENQAATLADAPVEENVSETSETEASPWSFRAPDITISEAAIDFMDESLPIRFRTVIGDLNGHITGLDSDPTKSLEVDLKGSVDGYAPVKLSGSASPLRSPPAIDLDLTFRGVDLARLTPYSGTYAGYAISRGTLNLDLGYSLDQDRLKGDNKVVIDQLKLGEKVESAKAVDIPLQLGIALLTDANGVIDLAVPVSGNVDDPKFSLSSVIWGAFANLITKAVTAPFRLLANLAGSDDDLQTVAYAAGSTDVDEVAQTKLRELADALNQRPQLTLVIVGRFNTESDGDKLRSQLLQQQLLADGLSQADIDSRNDAWQKAIARRYEALGRNAAETDNENSDNDQPPPAPAVQAQRLAAQLPLPPDALKLLAEERAASAKRFIVNEAGIPADRAVIERTNATDKGNTFSGVEMSIEL